MITSLQSTVPQAIIQPSNLPSVIVREGAEATKHFIEFFTAGIRNPNTREAYARNAVRFMRWCEEKGLALTEIQPFHVAAYIESLDLAVATIKQHHSSLKMLFDWLVVRQVMPFNPSSSVKTPRATYSEGKTPVLQANEVAILIESIKTSSVIGLRDRAFIATMAYSFARVSAVVRMNVGDFVQVGYRYQLHLHEKNGNERMIPVHHKLEEYLLSYINEAGFDREAERKEPLFRSVERGAKGRPLSRLRLHRTNALAMVKRRAKKAGFDPRTVMNHTFRGSGITTFLENDGKLEDAQYIAGHASSRTTKLYDRRQKNITSDDIDRIRFVK